MKTETLRDAKRLLGATFWGTKSAITASEDAVPDRFRDYETDAATSERSGQGSLGSLRNLYSTPEWISTYNPLMTYIDRSFIDTSPDDKLLRAFVTTGVRVVSALVNGDSWIALPDNLFQPPEARGWFQENWTGFKEAADRVVSSLRDIKEDVWERLRNSGLTWGHLRMKWRLWFEDLLSGRFNNILRRLNSILKSIATAIPLGECLGEYKEHVEMTLKDLANLNVGDATGLIDLSSAE